MLIGRYYSGDTAMDVLLEYRMMRAFFQGVDGKAHPGMSSFNVLLRCISFDRSTWDVCE